MPTFTAVKTTDNGNTSGMTSETSADKEIDTPDILASREKDNGNVPDSCSSIDKSVETYPAVTLATDGVETKTWSNQQITNSLYTHAVISVLISIVCSCLVSWFLVPQLMRSVQTPISRPPDPSPLPPTYDSKLIQRMIQNELVKEGEGLRMIQNELVKEGEGLRMIQNELVKEDEGLRMIQHELVKEGEGLRMIQNELVKEGEGLRMIQNELVKEYERLRMIQNELVKEGEGLRMIQNELVKEGEGLRMIQNELVKEDEGLRMIQNELVKEDEGLRMIQNELVKEDERLSRMQMKQSASFDAFRKEVNEKIQANVQQNDAFESNLKNRVEEETASRERLGLEFEKKVSDVKTELIADIDTRSVNLQKEARAHKTDIESLDSNHKSLRTQVERIQEEVKVVPGLQSNVENLSNNAEIQESHMKSVIRILTHPDVGPLHIAVVLLFMFVLYTWYLISTISRQHHRVVHSVERTEREHVSRHEPSILERVAVPRRLDNTVCILGFYKSTLELRTRLTQSVLEPRINQTHFLLDSHEDILRLPLCRLFLVFVDNNERHVILEDPSLGLGDLRLTTVRAIEKMRAAMVVIYYGDQESSNVGDHLFNRRLTSVHHQSELSALCTINRFFSTARKFTDRQIQALKNAVAAEIN